MSNSQDPTPATAPAQISCLSVISAQLSPSGQSEEALAIIAAGWKEFTQKNYSTAIKQWLRFCQRSGHAASPSSAGSLIAFLLELHREGRAYSTINSARSAISTLYSLDGNRLSEHPIVRRFMTGVRNLTPPVPKYPTSWKAETLLRFLKNWEVQANNLKEVSLKLVTTIACLSVQQMHTVTNVDREPKFEQAATYLFVFKDLKVARQRPYFIISLPSLSEADPLDTAKLLKTYLNLTAKLRAPDRERKMHSRLLILAFFVKGERGDKKKLPKAAPTMAEKCR